MTDTKEGGGGDARSRRRLGQHRASAAVTTAVVSTARVCGVPRDIVSSFKRYTGRSP